MVGLAVLRSGGLFVTHLPREALQHLLVGLLIEPGLGPLALCLVMGAILDIIELLVFLKLV